MKPASFSSRFAAFKLDLLLFMIIWEVLRTGLTLILPPTWSDVILLFFYFALSVVYFCYPTYKYGQTLGKRLLEIKVVTDGAKEEVLNFPQVLAREIPGKIFSGVPLFIGYLWAFKSPERTTWHDNLSKTKVISLRAEEEVSLKQKLRYFAVSAATIPLGVGFILFLVLYTSMPLASLKERLVAAGLEVGTVTGSLAGGLHISEFGRDDQEQNFRLKNVGVKFDLWSLFSGGPFLLENVQASAGEFEVPAEFSWRGFGSNLLFLSQSAQPGTASQGPDAFNKFKLHHLSIKNLSLSNEGKQLSLVEELTIKDFEKKATSFHVAEVVLKLQGFQVKALDVGSVSGQVKVGAVTGLVSPELVPLLKQPLDFQFKGQLAQNLEDSQIEGGLVMDKIKISYQQKKLKASIDNLVVNDLVKTKLPLENLNLEWQAEGATWLEILMKQEVSYGVKLCGADFATTSEIPTFKRGNRHFQFQMTPKPLVSFESVLSKPEGRLDDFFDYRMVGSISQLCYQKPTSQLTLEEREMSKKFAAALLVKEDFSIESVREIVTQARGLLRTGSYAQGLALLIEVKQLPTGFSAQESGAFYNLKAWLYFYSNQYAEAISNFDLAFQSRQDISDAEGLLRSNEILNKQEEINKWYDYIKTTLETHPELKNRLSANMQRKLASE